MSTTHLELFLTRILALKFRSNMSEVYYKLEKKIELDNISLGNFRV